MRGHKFFFLIGLLVFLASENNACLADHPDKRILLARDSILSFRSPKGYVPSLVHNFGVQFLSPLHMKSRQWITLGVCRRNYSPLVSL
jgi:hypothetical protein